MSPNPPRCDGSLFKLEVKVRRAPAFPTKAAAHAWNFGLLLDSIPRSNDLPAAISSLTFVR
jgi:hypothetical protein